VVGSGRGIDGLTVDDAVEDAVDSRLGSSAIEFNILVVDAHGYVVPLVVDDEEVSKRERRFREGEDTPDKAGCRDRGSISDQITIHSSRFGSFAARSWRGPSVILKQIKS
jgi:hypothetical protein